MVQMPFRMVSWSSAISIRISLEDSQRRMDRRRTRACGRRELSQAGSGLNIDGKLYRGWVQQHGYGKIRLDARRAVLHKLSGEGSLSLIYLTVRPFQAAALAWGEVQN